jgi:hypothetical protein
VRAAHFDRLFVYLVRVAVSITAGADDASSDHREA